MFSRTSKLVSPIPVSFSVIPFVYYVAAYQRGPSWHEYPFRSCLSCFYIQAAATAHAERLVVSTGVSNETVSAFVRHPMAESTAPCLNQQDLMIPGMMKKTMQSPHLNINPALPQSLQPRRTAHLHPNLNVQLRSFRGVRFRSTNISFQWSGMLSNRTAASGRPSFSKSARVIS